MKPIDRSLLEIFSSEQAEHVGRIRGLLEVLASSPGDAATAALEELQRRVHTLKGAAHAVGLESTEILVHRLESVFVRFHRGDAVLTPELRSLAEHTLQAFEDILSAALLEKDLPETGDLLQALEAASQGHAFVLPDVAAAATRSGISPAEPVPAGIAESDLVRVSARRIDDLVRSSSELLIAVALKTENEDPMVQYLRQLGDFQRECRHLRRGSGMGAVGEPSAELQKANASLKYADRELDSLLRGAQAVMIALDLRSREIRHREEELYESACQIRMTPAETVFAGSGSLVREIAHQENKPIEFRAEGLETQADRMVLQALKDPVLHLLRNAVSHGTETRTERVTAGKAPVNQVCLRIRARGDRLNLTIEDDGRGIDENAVIEEAKRRGLLPPAHESDSVNVSSLLLLPGLSTAKEVTSLAGRGLGLAIVQEAVIRLQGTLSIRPRREGGTVVSISVPLAMSTQRVLLVTAGGFSFGIASLFVERLLRVGLPEILIVDGRECVAVGFDAIRLVRLADLLGLPLAPKGGEISKLDVVIISVNDERFAVVVDALIDERDTIIKDSGLPASGAGLSVGAIPTDNGIVVVLNVPELFARTTVSRLQSESFLNTEPKKKTASVLVVDDSLTTRSLERSILEAHGYRVRVAVDGLQALEHVRLEQPDLVISDVMMPRMTGFELLAEIKRDKALQNIPVILVTSLESREDQARGLELGADAYIVKHRFDQGELIRIVRQVI